MSTHKNIQKISYNTNIIKLSVKNKEIIFRFSPLIGAWQAMTIFGLVDLNAQQQICQEQR